MNEFTMAAFQGFMVILIGLCIFMLGMQVDRNVVKNSCQTYHKELSYEKSIETCETILNIKK